MSVPDYWNWRTDYDKMMYSIYAPLAARPTGRSIEPDPTLYPVGYKGYPLNLKEPYSSNGNGIVVNPLGSSLGSSSGTVPKYWDWRTNYDKLQYSIYAPLAARPTGSWLDPDPTLYPVGYKGYPLNN